MLIAMDEIRDPAELGPTFLGAVNAGDLDAVMRCYDAQATLERPDGSTVTGRERIPP